MRNKKTVVFILSAAGLIVGGAFTARSAMGASDIYRASSVVDVDYEENLTEEERQINELINRQLCMQTAESMKEYEAFGLTYDAEEDQMYYGEVPVCYFADNLAADGSFEGTEMWSEKGSIGVVAKRDEEGHMIGLTQLDAQELESFLSNGWKKVF